MSLVIKSLNELNFTVKGLEKNYYGASSNVTVESMDFIYADSTSGTFTITLPSSPNSNDTVKILDTGSNFGTNSITLSAGSETIMGNASISLSTDNLLYTAIFTGTDWRLFY